MNSEVDGLPFDLDRAWAASQVVEVAIGVAVHEMVAAGAPPARIVKILADQIACALQLGETASAEVSALASHPLSRAITRGQA